MPKINRGGYGITLIYTPKERGCSLTRSFFVARINTQKIHTNY